MGVVPLHQSFLGGSAGFGSVCGFAESISGRQVFLKLRQFSSNKRVTSAEECRRLASSPALTLCRTRCAIISDRCGRCQIFHHSHRAGWRLSVEHTVAITDHRCCTAARVPAKSRGPNAFRTGRRFGCEVGSWALCNLIGIGELRNCDLSFYLVASPGSVHQAIGFVFLSCFSTFQRALVHSASVRLG